MDTEQVVRVALTIVTPIVTAGIGIVALVIGDWRERRTEAGRRKLSFEDASRQVEFAAQWFNASKLIAPDDERRAAAQAQAWLDEASDLVKASTPPPRSEQKRSVTVRRLLLAYPMQRRGARVLRGFYYFALGMVLLQVASALGSAFGRADTIGIPNYFSGGMIYADLLGIFVYTLIAMGFRYLALRVEESQPVETQRRLTVRDALLLQRFNGIRAHIARVVYWLWLLLTLLFATATVISTFEDPRVLPANLVASIAWVGWAVGLRYWAVSLSERAG
ncbi:hypothetical protein CQY20_14505 [Mycolicibacterium agri]|uniref:Uncharacterized protein n=1 Tax=Mycolicibacterium agri TaxID=36811 RepID=A0A2A7N1Z9_MYCAG|nr:hypothetical protein [Mycolicibacterium agri]PEG37926.1 hypothetical protein CQY20_14505 [Mycolicibacterium agri]GFG54651.1 hypothetical protein MAGR_60920 [Mycolicibacterium agri]